MEIGLGVLGLSSREFWDDMTLPELMAAIDGYVEANSPRSEDEEDSELSNDDKDQLLEEMERERTPEHKARLKKALANVKKMAAEKRKKAKEQGKPLQVVK